jgi:hypothetical protein
MGSGQASGPIPYCGRQPGARTGDQRTWEVRGLYCEILVLARVAELPTVFQLAAG